MNNLKIIGVIAVGIIITLVFFTAVPSLRKWVIITLIGDLSFGPGVHDFEYKVAGNYVLFRSSAHQIIVIPQGGWGEDTPIIPSKVIEIAWDNTYVLAKQQELMKRDPNDPFDNYEEPVPGKFHYWILNAIKPEVFGPMSYEDFLKKREELNISNSLILKDVYSYKDL